MVPKRVAGSPARSVAFCARRIRAPEAAIPCKLRQIRAPEAAILLWPFKEADGLAL